MASAGRRGDGPTLESCLAEARAGEPAPVYLFDGDAFLSGRAARELAAALVPEERRSLNLVELDAAAAPAEVAAELATVGLFAGAKVVLLSEPAFLSSKEDQDDAFRRARDLWSQGRQREAARRLLALAARAGWSAQRLAADDRPGGEDWERELAVSASWDPDFVLAAARFAVERDMKAAADDAAALDALLARGLPPGHVLLVAAGKVDGRLPLVKKLAGAGRRVAFQIEKEGRWDDERLVLGPVLEALLAGTGKRVDRGAEARLAELVGEDARTLAGEVQKLAAYVGTRQVIRAEDVDEVVARVSEDRFFAMGNAVEARDLEKALGVLDRTLADGASIHMVVGQLASTVRRMIEEKERGRRVAGERRLADAREWERRVWPSVSEEERGERKPYGFWMKYQASLRFGRGELLEALAGLAEGDLAAKSGREARPLVEGVLMRMLAHGEGRGGA